MTPDSATREGTWRDRFALRVSLLRLGLCVLFASGIYLLVIVSALDISSMSAGSAKLTACCGAAAVALGGLAQAGADLSSSRKSWKVIYPAGLVPPLFALLLARVPGRAGLHARVRMQTDRMWNEYDLEKRSRDVDDEAWNDVDQSLRSGTYWLMVVGGSVLLFLATVYDLR